MQIVNGRLMPKVGECVFVRDGWDRRAEVIDVDSLAGMVTVRFEGMVATAIVDYTAVYAVA